MRFSSVSRCCFLTLTMGTLTLLAGCSGSKKAESVTGTVKLDGKELSIGKINFVAPTGEKSSKNVKDVTAEIVDGAFTVKGVPIGDIKVTIETETAKNSFAQTTAQKTQLTSLKASKAKMKEQAKGFGQEADTSQLDDQIKELEESIKKVDAAEKKFRPVPKKYGDAASSGITVTIKAGSNSLDPIELSSK